jgi:hypothetical protein
LKLKQSKHKTRNNMNACVLLALFLAPLGVGLLVVKNDVSCATGDVMHPGDICTETRKGVTTTYTYDERAAYWKRMSYIAIGGGVLCAFGAVWYGRQWRRERQFA